MPLPFDGSRRRLSSVTSQSRRCPSMTKLSEIKRSVSGLTRKQLLQLDAWLHALLAAESVKPNSNKVKRHVLERHTTVNKTYQLETVRCGKKNCHCAEG